MDNVGFIFAAYAVTAALLGLYTVWILNRLRHERARETERRERGAGG